LPAYYVAAVLGVGVCFVDHTATFRTIWPNFFLVQPWFRDQNVAFGGNGVGWTLGVELTFYLVFPLIHGRVRGLSVRGLWITALVLVTFTIGWAFAIHPTSMLGDRYWLVDELPPVRLPEFVLGIVTAKLLRKGAIPRIPLWFASALAVVVFLLDVHVPLGFRIAALGVIPFALLVASVAQADLADSRSPFRNRVVVKLGTWSFCFYLTHQLCVRLLFEVRAHVHGIPAGVWLAVMLVTSLIAASLLCELVEKPFERRLRSDHQLPISVDTGQGPSALHGVGNALAI
jgi:peptidoglycan/LPS O-acetylase OafA/YrhL